MKKTFTINISGTVFHIDDDAYERLNNYIYQINRHFGSDADALEIVQDIESRISELFQERIKGGSEVITLAQVNEIILIMGMPEAFSDTAEQEKRVRMPRIRERKLYRDPDDRILGGVCSGLGAFFNLDPLVVRLIFVILFFAYGSSIIVYLILWVVVPKAANTAQRLEMKGEEVNINNISKSIREEIQDVKENYKNFRTNQSYIRGRDRLNDAGNLVISVLLAILKICVVFIGIVLVLAGIFAIIALFTSLFVSSEFLGVSPFGHGIHNYSNLFVSGDTHSWFWIGIGLTLGIPMIMLAYLGTKLIFRFKSNNHAFGLTALALWVIGIIVLIFASVRGLGEFKSVSTSTRQEALVTKSDTLYLKVGPDEFSDYVDSDIDLDGMRIASVNGKNMLLNKPRVNIVKSETGEFSILLKSRARGRDLDMAQNNTRQITYKYTQQDSLLTFQPWFMLPENTVWRKQEVDILVKVPENKTIYIDQDMTELLYDVENSSNLWDSDMGGKYWTMKADGLELTQRKAPTETTNK